MLRLWLAITAGVVVLLGSGLVASMARAQPGPDPAAVITAFETARNRRDIDGALAYFADDATITQRTTTFTGKDDIRKYLEGLTSRSRSVVVSDRHASGNLVSWSERAGVAGPGQSAVSQGGGFAQGGVPQAFVINVEAVVQDGKIVSLTYLPGGGAARIDPAVDGRAQLPASVGLGAVLAVVVGLLALASTGVRRAPVASTLRGRLMHDLQGWSTARQSG